ncbi:hypothetical protein MVLG_05765 [Microbotryum lychnidis-dioicae p1A1 Lamole]|uniref:Uncharacterized protein n=1 Tax=Microbotryum lychnidis-dioicae (strain p1A1 Lamole / MvSl-1064) TaxID=683840 RepID=U5HF83_USTV1|nr:hypothetical protein MVLG_05765 [Microbotryum lychnidis-dioicae p1A1 Lamole]|eukprot:KDE03761.1 hypothetical protein MVLG_05765 [Microbotryum lychnidis-dioicae p1A1 Lamole]
MPVHLHPPSHYTISTSTSDSRLHPSSFPITITFASASNHLHLDPLPSPLRLFLPIAPPPSTHPHFMLLFFDLDLDLDRQPRLHHTANLLLASSTSTSTFASTSGFGVTGGFLVRQSAVQDVMTGINDESTTVSTKAASTGNAAGQVRLEDGDDGEEVGISTPTGVLFFVFSLFG